MQVHQGSVEKERALQGDQRQRNYLQREFDVVEAPQERGGEYKDEFGVRAAAER